MMLSLYDGLSISTASPPSGCSRRDRRVAGTAAKVVVVVADALAGIDAAVVGCATSSCPPPKVETAPPQSAALLLATGRCASTLPPGPGDVVAGSSSAVCIAASTSMLSPATARPSSSGNWSARSDGVMSSMASALIVAGLNSALMARAVMTKSASRSR